MDRNIFCNFTTRMREASKIYFEFVAPIFTTRKNKLFHINFHLNAVNFTQNKNIVNVDYGCEQT